MGASIEQARAAKSLLRANFDGEQDVLGIGLGRGDDGYMVRVNVRRSGVAVPESVDGVTVVTRVVAPASPQPAASRRRPATRPSAANAASIST